MELLVCNLTKIPFFKCLVSIYLLIAEVLNDQNLFTESSLGDWFSSHVQFYSGGRSFSEPAAAARQCGKVNHLEDVCDRSALWFVRLTLNRPGFLESSTAGRGGSGFRFPCVTSLFEDQ